MILSRLRVQEKLGLILLLPVTAVILLAVPFVADRIDDARSATVTATAARNARPVGGLVQELQRERLLSLVFLTSTQADRGALVTQAQRVDDEATDVRAQFGQSITAPLAEALEELDALDSLREGVLTRRATVNEVYQQFGERVGTLIEALRLAPQLFADTSSAQQIGTLDALLRANEANSAAGAALVVEAGNRTAGALLGAEASAAERLHTNRFLQLATPEQVGLLRTVTTGRASRRLQDVATQLRSTPGRSGEAAQLAAAAFGAVESQTGLRRLVQDDIAREVIDDASGRARGAGVAAGVFAGGALLLFALVIGLGITVSGSIARPLARLTRAATMVAELARTELIRVSDEERSEERAPRLAAIDVASQDEVGELANAFNQVQASAALLLERQVVSRRNVASMFANVGRRTQNLVNRQLALIDELERNEQNPQLLAQLYQLDHISTRLRRSAYSLLVVSGSQDQVLTARSTSLPNVVRSALGEIEGFRQVRLGRICDVEIVADLVSDLALLLAELLENATSFSPPQTPVDAHAELIGTFCRISVVDHGIGMPPDQMAEENRRLVERERLDVVPTSVLGLFVVGRLARRHGLAVRLVPTAGRGVTAQIDIPNTLFSHNPAAPLTTPAPRTITVAPEPTGPRALVSAPRALPSSGGPMGGFTWFPADSAQRTEERSAPAPAEAAPAQAPAASSRPSVTPGQRRAGLIRRVPGAQLIDPDQQRRPAARTRQEPRREPRHQRSPEDARATVEAFEAGAVRAAREHLSPVPNPPSQAVPPAHRMAPDHRTPPPDYRTPPDHRGASGHWAPPTRPAPPAHAAPPVRPVPPVAPPIRPVPPMRSVPPGRPTPAMAQDGPIGSTRNGLTRRVPGAHLAEALHGERPSAAPSSRPASDSVPSSREPESERDTLNAFLEGFAEGRARQGTESG